MFASCCCPAAICTAGREREWEEIERVVFGRVLLCSLYDVQLYIYCIPPTMYGSMGVWDEILCCVVSQEWYGVQ